MAVAWHLMIWLVFIFFPLIALHLAHSIRKATSSTDSWLTKRMLCWPFSWLLSPRNALRWGCSNAAVVPCVRPCVRPCVDLVNTIATKLLRVSLSNLADMLTRMGEWILLILEVRGQRSRSQRTYMEVSLWTRYTLNRCAFLYQTWQTC